MRSAVPAHAALAAIATLFVLGAAELGLRALVPAETLPPAWSEEFWRAHHARHGCAALHGDLEPDPRLGWRMRRSYRGPGVTHDARGFRRTGRGPPAPGAPRIFLIGDSFTYGLGVEDEATFAAQLARRTGAHVINAGVNAYGLDQALLMWEEEGRALHPDVVVLGYYTDDFHRNALPIRDAPKPRFVRDRAGAWREEPPGSCAQLAARHARGWRLPALLGAAVRTLDDRAGRLPVAMLRERRGLSRRLLARLRQSVASEGASLLVLLIPHCRHPDDGRYGGWVMPRLARDCRELGLRCLDFTTSLSPEWFGPNCHWSPRGHQRAAGRIARTLGLPGKERELP